MLVVATPCPLLIAIPVAIIGSISLAARRGIIIKDPAVLEKIDTCRTAIFDKTGTLTYGQPQLTEVLRRPRLRRTGRPARWSPAWSATPSTRWPAPSSKPHRDAGLTFSKPAQISERPGEGLRGPSPAEPSRSPAGRSLRPSNPDCEASCRPLSGGLECVVLDRRPLRRDLPLPRSAARRRRPVHPPPEAEAPFRPGDARLRRSRIGSALPGRTGRHRGGLRRPDARSRSWRSSARRRSEANTVFLGDGINDAPALTAATVGIAFGQNSDITAEAAGAVIMDSSLRKVDEFLHISRRMRPIALQSAVGGMALSLVGMAVAAAGYLPPVAGAVVQEVIDVVAVRQRPAGGAAAAVA